MDKCKPKGDLEKLLSSFVDNEVRNNGFSINPENPMERFDEWYSIIRALIMVPDLKNYDLVGEFFV
jgi:hypothetical protein